MLWGCVWGAVCLGRAGAPVREVAGWKLLCQLTGSAFAFPLCPHKLSLGGISPGFEEMLILVTGLSPAYMSGLLFRRAPGAQVVLGRRRMKGGKGQGGRSGRPWDHVIVWSTSGLLFLVNVSVGRDSCCCAVEGPGECAAHPAATFIITITLIIF